jgi:hypothetical protein
MIAALAFVIAACAIGLEIAYSIAHFAAATFDKVP